MSLADSRTILCSRHFSVFDLAATASYTIRIYDLTLLAKYAHNQLITISVKFKLCPAALVVVLRFTRAIPSAIYSIRSAGKRSAQLQYCCRCCCCCGASVTTETEHKTRKGINLPNKSTKKSERWNTSLSEKAKAHQRWPHIPLTRSAAVAEEPRDALRQLKSYQLVQSCTKITLQKACSRWMPLKVTQGHLKYRNTIDR